MATGEVDPSTHRVPLHPRDFWWGGLGLVASLLGVQSLVSSGASSAQVLMLLPSNGPVSAVGDGLRRGYGLAMAEAMACGVNPPSLELGWLPIGEDPRPFLVGRSQPRLLIAPPAVSSLPYGLLAQQQNINVLLPLQRGSSLQRLPSQPGADRLWPVLPGRSQEADHLARALVKLSRDKAMVIHDGNGELVALADRFTETLSGAGGWVVGPANRAIGIAKPTKAAMDQLLTDINWYKPESVVVMTSPGSPLAKAVTGSTLPTSLTLVWPFPAKTPFQNPQLGVEPLSRGPGWSRFARAFEQRHGFQPGLVEAAGYDTGQLAVLAAPGAAGKDGWQLDWLNPRSKPLGLCAALQARAKGSGLALNGAASRLDLSAANPPTGEMRLTTVKALPLAAGP
jgi:hypothetical protein